MAAKASSSKPTRRSGSEDVEAFLEVLDHSFKQEILALRQLILAVDPAIMEEIKWNAPSFRTMEHFATMHLRARDAIHVILHLGAKKRDTATAGMTIADPEGLLVWLAADRASVAFHDLHEIEAHRAAFTQIIRQWITHI